MSMRCTHDNDYPNVPSLDPDLGTFHTCQFSTEWLQVVLGAVERLKLMCWETPDGNPLLDFGVWDSLLDMLATEVTPGGDGLIIGEMRALTTETSDPRLLWCKGQTIYRVDYPELFDAWNNTNAQMDLPNLQGRYLKGPFVNQPYHARQLGGVAQVTIQPNNLPPHTHKQRTWNGHVLTDQNPTFNGPVDASTANLWPWSNTDTHTDENETDHDPLSFDPLHYSVLWHVVAKL